MKYLFITISVLFLSLQLYGNTTIEGRLSEDISRDGKVYLEVHENYLVKFNAFYALNLSDSVDVSGRFKFEIKDPAAYYYINIYYEEEKGRRLLFYNGNLNLHLVQANSKLNFLVDKKGIRLYGENNDLSVYQEKLTQIHPVSKVKFQLTDEGFNDDIHELRRCIQRIDSVSNLFADRLPEVSEKLAFNYKCYWIKAMMSYFSLNALSNEGTVLNKDAIEALGNLLVLAQSYTSHSLDSRLLYNYVDMSYSIEINKMKLESSYWKKGQAATLAASLQENYDGYMQEQLLLTFYLAYATENKSVSEINLQSIASKIKDSFFVRTLNEFKANHHMGAKVYPFVFQDTDDHMFSLADFKGELLLIEFWFKGCPACSYLNKALEKVMDDNGLPNKLKHITINVDKDKESFLTGVASGKYTNKGSLNLWVGTDGYQHDMLMKYNYYGYPQLMLVDRNGNLVDTFLPKPTTPDKVTQFLRIINKYL